MKPGEEVILTTEDDVHEAWDKAEEYAHALKHMFGEHPPFSVGVKNMIVKQGKTSVTTHAIYLKKTRGGTIEE